MLNRCEFIGNVGRDPDIRKLQNGDTVANLSIAVNETWRDKTSGEKKEKVEWIRVTAWRQLAEIVEKYVKKGDKLYIAGKMETRKWQDQSGEDRYTTEIILSGFDSKLVMLGGKGDGGSSERSPEPSGGGGGGGPVDDLDDEIPFVINGLIDRKRRFRM